jgi:hypothetical protein
VGECGEEIMGEGLNFKVSGGAVPFINLGKMGGSSGETEGTKK